MEWVGSYRRRHHCNFLYYVESWRVRDSSCKQHQQSKISTNVCSHKTIPDPDTQRSLQNGYVMDILAVEWDFCSLTGHACICIEGFKRDLQQLQLTRQNLQIEACTSSARLPCCSDWTKGQLESPAQPASWRMMQEQTIIRSVFACSTNMFFLPQNHLSPHTDLTSALNSGRSDNYKASSHSPRHWSRSARITHSPEEELLWAPRSCMGMNFFQHEKCRMDAQRITRRFQIKPLRELCESVLYRCCHNFISRVVLLLGHMWRTDKSYLHQFCWCCYWMQEH